MMRVRYVSFLATLIFRLLLIQLWQPAGATLNANTVYLFVEIETKVHRAGVETSSEWEFQAAPATERARKCLNRSVKRILLTWKMNHQPALWVSSSSPRTDRG